MVILITTTFNAYSRYRSIGFFDVAHPSEGCQGWALDPDNGNANLTIHFYANAPAGSPGSVLIGTTVANRYRPDVNAATGYSGSHGFLWYMPITFTTPCRLLIYAYAIDLNGDGNPLLTNGPKLMPLLIGTVSNFAGVSRIYVSASSQYAGAINSVTWNNKEFIYSEDHGQELQSATSFYSSLNSWTAECYNPTEAGSQSDGNSSCTNSRLLQFSANGNVLNTKTQMAFFGSPTSGTVTCSTPINTVVTSNHIMEKTVEVGLPGMPHAIKYHVTFSIPSDEVNLAIGQFEVVTGYLKSEFYEAYLYNQFTQGLEYYPHEEPDGEQNKPMILSTIDGNYAMGIYSPGVPKVGVWGQGYGRFRFPDQGTYKWNLVRRIENVVAGSSYSFDAYIAVGSLENVRVTLSQLVAAFPNG